MNPVQGDRSVPTKSVGFWIRRFFLALAIAFVGIAAGQYLLRERTLDYAIQHGLIWGVVSAAIFTATALYRWRKGRYCALCATPPESSSADPGSPT